MSFRWCEVAGARLPLLLARLVPKRCATVCPHARIPLLPAPIRSASYRAACGQAVCFAPAEGQRPVPGTVRLEFSLRPSYRPLRHRRDGSVDAQQRVLVTGPGQRATTTAAQRHGSQGPGGPGCRGRTRYDSLSSGARPDSSNRPWTFSHAGFPFGGFRPQYGRRPHRIKRTDLMGTQSVPRGTDRGAGMDVTAPSRSPRRHCSPACRRRAFPPFPGNDGTSINSGMQASSGTLLGRHCRSRGTRARHETD